MQRSCKVREPCSDNPCLGEHVRRKKGKKKNKPCCVVSFCIELRVFLRRGPPQVEVVLRVPSSKGSVMDQRKHKLGKSAKNCNHVAGIFSSLPTCKRLHELAAASAHATPQDPLPRDPCTAAVVVRFPHTTGCSQGSSCASNRT